MARMHAPFGFTGTLRGISAYTMRGVDKIILRTPGGPSKKDITTKAAYHITRRNNKEFGGRSTSAKWIRRAFQPLKPILDYNISSPLNSLLKPIQEMDRQSEFGKRNLLISLAPQLLEGLNFNRKFPFDSVVLNAIGSTLSRESMSATVAFPALLPGASFFAPGVLPFYRVIIVLGLVPDLYYGLPNYQPQGNYESFFPVAELSEWYPVKSGSPAFSVDLKLPLAPENDSFSLVLSAGIQMGSVEANGDIAGVRYMGSGKILAMKGFQSGTLT